jgi:hypothetical protein
MKLSDMIRKNITQFLIEKYQTYSNYTRLNSSWGSPADLKDDAILSITKLLPTRDDKWIKSITDESTDQGIKFKILLDNDITIHMFKLGSWRGQWEYYLNRKRISAYDLENKLDNIFLTSVDTFLKYVRNYDFFVDYIDDGARYRAVLANNNKIEQIFKDLSVIEKEEAIKKMNKLPNFDINLARKIFKSK